MRADCLGWKSEGTDWLVLSDLLKTTEVVRDHSCIIPITLHYLLVVQNDQKRE